MTTSTRMSREFYKKIRAKGLASRTKKQWDLQIIKTLKSKIRKNQQILDVGCGYGRILVPLAKQGYNLQGTDLSPNLIKDAKEYSKKEKVKIKFKVGNMCNLPYKKNSFDVILCMWSAFNELLTIKEQTQAIKGILKILKNGGWALFEMGLYQKPAKQDIKPRKFYGPGKRIKKDIIDGIRNDHYNHDKKSLSKLMKQTNIKNYKVYIAKLAGRNRLFLRFRK